MLCHGSLYIGARASRPRYLNISTMASMECIQVISVREFCNLVKNTQVFERSCMSNVVCKALFDLSDPQGFNMDIDLVEPYTAPRKLASIVHTDFGLASTVEVLTARKARYSQWGVCAVGDFVLVKDDRSFLAGRVWRHIRFHGELLSLIQLGDCMDYDGNAGYAVWKLRADPEWGCTKLCLDSLVFTWLDDMTVRTLIPSQFRW